MQKINQSPLPPTNPLSTHLNRTVASEKMETGVLGTAIKGELNDAHLSTDLKYEEIKKNM
jgi:hypothetical protein